MNRCPDFLGVWKIRALVLWPIRLKEGGDSIGIAQELNMLGPQFEIMLLDDRLPPLFALLASPFAGIHAIAERLNTG